MTRLRADDGFSVIDMMVGLVLAGILMAGVGGVFRTAYAATRTAGDAVRGDDDTQLLVTYLTRDAHAAVADTLITSVGGGGSTLTLGVVEAGTAVRFTTVTYAYDAGAGTITRTVNAAGLAPVTLTLAHSLEPSYTPVFEYCSPITLTITPAITGGATPQTVAVSTTANVKPGIELSVGGASAETVVVTDVGVGTVTAVFVNNHTAGTSATNACLSVAANVPFRINGSLIVRTLRTSLRVRP